MGRQAVQAPVSNDDFFAGEWLVQPSLNLVSCGDVCRHVAPKTIEVLVCLASHPNQVFPKDEILSTVWPDVFVSDDVLTHAIWDLRQTFGNESIQTIRGRGYRLTLPIARIGRKIRSLAVLPLANLSGQSGEDYLADGITEALISALAQIRGLRVVSRTSVMQYKNTVKSLPQIARELSVDGVIEGSLIRNGSAIRFSMQLIDASSDSHVFARNYESSLGNCLQLQDEIACTIASKIELPLTKEEHVRLSRLKVGHSAANEAYLKGRYFHSRMSEDGLRKSIDFMRQATAVDSDFALAYAAMADSAGILSLFGTMPPNEATEIMKPAVARALELDPKLPEAHLMSGWVKLSCDWEWRGAEEELRHAIGLNPSCSNAYCGLAKLYEAMLRSEEALAAWQQACVLDPLSLLNRTLFAGSYLLAGRPDEAIRQLDEVLALEPNFWLAHEVRGFVLTDLGRHEAAMVAAESAVRLSPDPMPKTSLAYVSSNAGRPDLALRVLNDLEELAKIRYVSPLLPGAVLVSLGRYDDALDRIEQGYEVRDPGMAVLRGFPFWRRLKEHPRFQAIVKRMQFPEYRDFMSS